VAREIEGQRFFQGPETREVFLVAGFVELLEGIVRNVSSKRSGEA